MKHSSIKGTNKTVLLLIAGFTVIVLIFIGFVAVGEQRESKKMSQVIQYKSADTEKPVVSIETDIKDVGNMKVTEEKTVGFTLKNIGTKPLSLFNISSSCGCTAGQVTIGSQKSPEGQMHQRNSWIGTLSPGELAVVSVIYRPNVMPVKGDVTRSVYVDTNDPDNKTLTFSITAFVE